MPPKGYKTISLKTPIAERLTKEATEIKMELSVFVKALMEFTKYPAKQEWIDFLTWYKENEAKGVGQ